MASARSTEAGSVLVSTAGSAAVSVGVGTFSFSVSAALVLSELGFAWLSSIRLVSTPEESALGRLD